VGGRRSDAWISEEISHDLPCGCRQVLRDMLVRDAFERASKKKSFDRNLRGTWSKYRADISPHPGVEKDVERKDLGLRDTCASRGSWASEDQKAILGGLDSLRVVDSMWVVSNKGKEQSDDIFVRK